MKFVRSPWMLAALGYPPDGTLPAAVVSLRDGRAGQGGRGSSLLRLDRPAISEFAHQRDRRQRALPRRRSDRGLKAEADPYDLSTAGACAPQRGAHDTRTDGPRGDQVADLDALDRAPVSNRRDAAVTPRPEQTHRRSGWRWSAMHRDEAQLIENPARTNRASPHRVSQRRRRRGADGLRRSRLENCAGRSSWPRRKRARCC